MSLCRNLLIANQNKTIYNALKRDMVLWYDLKKQGATNESMSADPRLIDLSGNENHATCNNFAWKGDSGIGLYSNSLSSIFERNFIKEDAYISRGTGIMTNEKIIINSITASINFIETENNYADSLPPLKIRISNLPKNYGLSYTRNSSTTSDGSVIKGFSYNMLENGEYTLPEIIKEDLMDTNNATNVGYVGFKLINSSGVGTIISSCNIIIELIPNYENSLVFDGIDDFCKVEGLPIFTPEIGYTVIVKRNIFKNIGSVCSKSFIIEKGSFVFEHTENFEQTFSFGNTNNINFPDLISYQTSSKYNDIEISKGSTEDSDKLWIGAIRDNDDKLTSMALYSIILFKRDLTEQEIQWVINNLI